MTTKREALQKAKAMLNRDFDEGTVLQECKRLLDSGGVEPTEFTDYELARILIHVALKNKASQYRLISDKNVKAANNLAYF